MIKLTPFQWSSFQFFCFYCAYGVLLPFFPIWLNHHGYNAELIGLIIALGYIFRFIGAMLFSQRVSHFQFIPISRILTWLTILILVIMMWGVENSWILLPTIALFHIFNGGAMPLIDAISSTWQKQIGLDYGKTRLFGSLAFVVGSVSTGYLIGWFGEASVILIITGWLVFLGIGTTLNPSQTFLSSAKSELTNTVSYWQLFKQPTTLKMMIAISLIQSSHAAYYAYSTIYWKDAGTSTQEASLLWGVAVCAEIFFFFIANRMFKMWKLHSLFLVCAVGTIIRWVMLSSTSDFKLLVIIQLLHAISYGMGHYAMIRYIATQSAEHIAKLQALYFGSASCVFMALFTFLSGLIYPHFPEASFWLMAIVVVPAIFIVPKQIMTKF